MMTADLFQRIFNNKKVLITGHTGFKGAWLTIMLNKLGADLYGYALEPPTEPSIFKEARLDNIINSHIGDIRNVSELKDVVTGVKPDYIFHMAAQSLVRPSYNDPLETYSVNTLGTLNLLETIRQLMKPVIIINVTTDKCYENKEWIWGYREIEPMGGYDPYSNSKACSELITSCYRLSYFNPKEFNKHGIALASARAGNVIGGGDWAIDRLIPDFIRAINLGKQLKIRNPYAIRPWQHVLEPLSGYLTLALKLSTDGSQYADAWNFGPNEEDAKNVEWISKNLCEKWGKGASYSIDEKPHPYEANYLKLDCSKAKTKLGWQPVWDIDKALHKTVSWAKAYNDGEDVYQTCLSQISEYWTSRNL